MRSPLFAGPPLTHLRLSLDVLLTGPLAHAISAEYPHGLTISFGGPALPLSLEAVSADPALNAAVDPIVGSTLGAVRGATAKDGAGLRVLLGYGATRSTGESNPTVSPYALISHAAAGKAEERQVRSDPSPAEGLVATPVLQRG